MSRPVELVEAWRWLRSARLDVVAAAFVALLWWAARVPVDAD